MKNRSQSPRPAPPAWIIKIIEKRMAAAARKRALGIGTTYDPRKAIGEACLFGLAFLGAPWRAVLAVITVAFGTLRMRDQWIHPAKGTAAEAATDALVTAAGVVMSQAYFLVKSPSFAIADGMQLAHGAGIGMMVVTAVRMAFHLLTPKNDPHQLDEFRIFRAALRINVMVVVAVALVAVSNVQAVPGGHMRDFMMCTIPVISCGIMLRLGRSYDGSLIWEAAGKFSIFTDPVREEADRAAGSLPEPAPELSSSDRFTICAQAVFVISLLMPIGIAAWRWWSGEASSVDWWQLWANLIVLIVLLPVWRIITYINAAIALLLNRVRTADFAGAGFRACPSNRRSSVGAVYDRAYFVDSRKNGRS